MWVQPGTPSQQRGAAGAGREVRRCRCPQRPAGHQPGLRWLAQDKMLAFGRVMQRGEGEEEDGEEEDGGGRAGSAACTGDGWQCLTEPSSASQATELGPPWLLF